MVKKPTRIHELSLDPLESAPHDTPPYREALLSPSVCVATSGKPYLAIWRYLALTCTNLY